MLRKLMLVLGGTMLALTIALPASASHAKPVKPAHANAPSPHALCLQALAQAKKTFNAQQRAATKALHVDQRTARKALRVSQKAARKALHAQQKADLAAFKLAHPNATEAELKAFHDAQKAATKALHDAQKAARKALHVAQKAARKALHAQQKAARATFHAQQEAARKACPKPSRLSFVSREDSAGVAPCGGRAPALRPRAEALAEALRRPRQGRHARAWRGALAITPGVRGRAG
jgi:hypothetical protein